MKITMVLLIVIAFASLMQMPVSEAEESSTSTSSSLAERNAKSSTLIRKKRWFWKAWNWFKKWVLPVVAIVASVILAAIPIVNVITGVAALTVSNALLIGAAVGNAVHQTVELVDTMQRRNLNTGTTEDDVDLNLEIIDKVINRNFKDDNPLKKEIEEKHPELSESIQFSKDGFKCGQEFCEKHGNGIHAFGVCSPYACECGLNGAEERMCEEHSIYDPVYQACEDPLLVKICGF